MQEISCIIIEDQIPAQRILKRYINDIPYLKLEATFGDCLSAIPLLNQQEISLAFLDINLPKLSGLNFLRSLQNPPGIIITTAYPQYALEGFELDVMDYLLKPFSFSRFVKAVSKFSRSAGLPPSATKEEKGDFVFIKSDKTLHRVDLDAIIYVKAEGDFVQVATTSEKHFLSNTLKYWAAILPAHLFVQAHRSFIVNLARIERIRGNEIYMAGETIPIGRSYKEGLLIKIGQL